MKIPKSTPEVESHLQFTQGQVVSEAKHLGTLAYRLIRELEELVEETDQVMAEPDEAKGIHSDIPQLDHWMKICASVTKLDNQIKGYNDLKELAVKLGAKEQG